MATKNTPEVPDETVESKPTGPASEAPTTEEVTITPRDSKVSRVRRWVRASSPITNGVVTGAAIAVAVVAFGSGIAVGNAGDGDDSEPRTSYSQGDQQQRGTGHMGKDQRKQWMEDRREMRRKHGSDGLVHHGAKQDAEGTSGVDADKP